MTDLLQKDWYVLQNGMWGTLGYRFDSGWEFTPRGDDGFSHCKVYVSVWNGCKAIGIAQFVKSECVCFICSVFQILSDEKYEMLYSEQFDNPVESKLYDYLDNMILKWEITHYEI